MIDELVRVVPAAVRPDDIDRRARTVLPAHDAVAPQLPRAERGVRAGRRREWPKAVGVRARVRRDARLANVREPTLGQERLAVELEGEIGRDRVAQPRAHRYLPLLETREGVVRDVRRVRKIPEPLRVVVSPVDVGADVRVQSRRQDDVDVRTERRPARAPLVTVVEVEPHAAGERAPAVRVDAAPRIEPHRLAERRTAARAAIAIARREVREGVAEVNVPIVEQAHMAIEVHRVLEPRARRIPLLPVIAVDLRPAIDTVSILETQRRPRAPVEDVGPSEIAEIIDLEACRLPQETRFESRDPTTVL